MKEKLFIPLAALSIFGLTNVSDAGSRRDRDREGYAYRDRDGRYVEKDYDVICAPEEGAPCFPDEPPCAFCLGPDNIAVNAPVNPITCNGDIVITVAGFYWNAHQDGMQYAIDNQIVNPNASALSAVTTPTLTAAVQQLNNIIDAKYKSPDFKWDFGFKLGLAYNSTHDGWDLGVLWTWYRGRASSHIEAELDDNHTLLPLWSAFAPLQGLVLYATDIEAHWKLKLNLIDIELGREYWVSRYLTFRPHFGLRIAFIEQDLHLEHKGGSWSARTADPIQTFALNNEVDLDNDFKGVGVRGGFDTVWNFGRGWALYGNFAGSIVYGRFNIEHEEENQQATAPHLKTDVLDTEDHFRVSRGMLDLVIGVQWATMFSQCRYGLTVMLGWEHHLFFNQNQMWRVMRIGDTPAAAGAVLPNNTGENVYHQRRGDLSTQGWTLTLKFEF